MARKQLWQRVTTNPHVKNAAGVLVSDIIGAGVGLGGMAVFENIAPRQLTKIEEVVGRGIVKLVPDLNRVGPQFANLTPEETEEFQLLSREEQGRIVAKPATELMIAGLLSLGSGVAAQSWMDRHYGNSYEGGVINKARTIDFAVQSVSMVLVNTVGNKYTQTAISACSKILQNTFGMERKRADYLSSYFMRYEAPNLIGNIANLMCLHHFGNGGSAPRSR